MPEIFIVGNFGGTRDQVDGQTIKTRVLRDGLVAALGRGEVLELDSLRCWSSPLGFLRSARAGIRDGRQSVMLPAERGLAVLLPFFLHWKAKFKKPLQYVVIGGWLPELLAAKRSLCRWCARLDNIFVETAAMAEKLNRLGLKNVAVMPNFRKFDRGGQRDWPAAGRPLKLVFCSRVMPEKGIEEAIAAVARLNGGSAGPQVTLDIFGPIASRYQDAFFKAIGRDRAVCYGGVLPPDNVPDTLRRYDLMLFPTYYAGEGFPGAVLDSFIAGLPVIASDWKYNREIITEGATGAFCQIRSAEDLAARVKSFADQPERLAPMRRHCAEQALRYHVDVAVQQLLKARLHCEPSNPS